MEAKDHDLVRLAYFVLPGKGKRIYRLALARRIVDRTAGGDRVRRRTRVLRRAMRPPRRFRIGLGPWLRAMPARLPDPLLTAALAKLEPEVRVAYVLRYVAGTPRYAVRDQLVRLGVRDPRAVMRAAEEAHEDGSVPAAPPDADLFGPDGLRPVQTRSPLPVLVATALTVVLIGAMVVSEDDLRGTSSAAARNLRLTSAAPDAWRTAPRSLDLWPARGDLAADKAFTGRALRAWIKETEAGRTGPPGNPQLLFAGHVDGRPVALLRRADQLARFTGQSGPDGPMAVSTVGTDPEHPMSVGGGRYLLAPWQRAETLTGGKVAATGGVTAPATARTRCRRGPVLHVLGDGATRTVGEFGGPRPVTLTHRSAGQSPGRPSGTSQAALTAKTTRLGKPATGRPAPGKPAVSRLDAAGVRAWERVACLTSRPTRPVTEATAWEFWSGTLPYGWGRAQWVCTSMTFAGGGNAAQATFLDGRGARGTGWCDDRRPVSGTWWRSPGGGWYYLAAAGRGLTPHADGPFRSVSVRSRLLIASSSGGTRRPAEPVTLTARSS
jgi:hypothetical protein